LHHIIPLNGGGVNIRLNLIPLCFDCHAEIHPWLKDGSENNGEN
jgi:5-methylcytosine-specific restriction endonuclease McrA